MAVGKRHDEALYQSAITNQAILDSLTTQIALLNATGVIIAVNQAWKQFAATNGDVDMLHTGIGINYLDICQSISGPDSADAERVSQGIAAVLARTLDLFTFEYPCHSPNEQRWFIMRVTPLASKQMGAVVAHENITERKFAEEMLIREHGLMQALMDNIPDTIYFKDTSSRFLRINQAQAHVLNLSDISEAVGKLDADFQTPQLASEFYVEEQHLFQTGQPVIDRQEYNPIRNGQPRWFSTTKVPMLDHHGQVIGLIGISRDITERKRLEAALIEERGLLARRVAEQTADLSRANAELIRAVRLKDEFLAGMSHELRTPLTAILGFSEVLREQIYGALNEQQLQRLKSIEASGRHLLDLINDILDLAKIDAGMLDLTIEPVLIDPICHASMQIIKQAAHHKHLAVTTRIDPAVVQIQGDARRLKQILINLLANAVKFTPAGGAIGLEVFGDLTERVVRFSIWDTGIGIADEHMDNLFQPFVQLDSQLARQYEGTGLGLALVARMAELHGGSVSVTSTVGVGSRFTVTLPWNISPLQANPSLPIQHGPANTLNTFRRALIIDDSPTAVEHLTRYFNEIGITSVVPVDGSDICAHVIATKPELIILDILLAGMSGWDVLRALKADPRTQDIPVIIASVVDDRQRAMTLGAAGYLVKPLTRAALQSVLETLESSIHQALGQYAVGQPPPHTSVQRINP